MACLVIVSVHKGNWSRNEQLEDKSRGPWHFFAARPYLRISNGIVCVVFLRVVFGRFSVPNCWREIKEFHFGMRY